METQPHHVIAIGRQYGSGGREIGRRVAARLGYSFYDNELLTLAAKHAGLDPEVAAQAEERPTNGLLYNAPLGLGAARGAPFRQFADYRFAAEHIDIVLYNHGRFLPCEGFMYCL